ncbi:CLUMA_CG020574, isoform A [Clunio marinus]|uniref:CLUMA_CG020574, isoform A n=1 Tax=Clunio marinus TaxID=568069 RepID=A0A1J1J9C5_9DIPT|nr:CLUMA_CG020574, isoform A [Clunio marinus]
MIFISGGCHSNCLSVWPREIFHRRQLCSQRICDTYGSLEMRAVNANTLYDVSGTLFEKAYLTQITIEIKLPSKYVSELRRNIKVEIELWKIVRKKKKILVTKKARMKVTPRLKLINNTRNSLRGERENESKEGIEERRKNSSYEKLFT